MEENALEIRGLQKSFGEYRLGPLNLTLPNGYIMGLIGENGAGKSTTMRLILGMIKKDAGSIRVLGQDVDAPGFFACGRTSALCWMRSECRRA